MNNILIFIINNIIEFSHSFKIEIITNIKTSSKINKLIVKRKKKCNN